LMAIAVCIYQRKHMKMIKEIYSFPPSLFIIVGSMSQNALVLSPNYNTEIAYNSFTNFDRVSTTGIAKQLSGNIYYLHLEDGTNVNAVKSVTNKN
jgi:hypothetical protein